MHNQISHDYNWLAAHILYIGFIGQFKEWWEGHLIIDNILVATNKDESNLQDRNTFPETETTLIYNVKDILDIFISNDVSGITKKGLLEIFPNSIRYQHLFLTKLDKNKVHRRDFLKGLLRSQYKKKNLLKETTYKQIQQAD